MRLEARKVYRIMIVILVVGMVSDLTGASVTINTYLGMHPSMVGRPFLLTTNLMLLLLLWFSVSLLFKYGILSKKD
mgnify:CR=1 FL=1